MNNLHVKFRRGEIMREQLVQRLRQLKAEFESGQRILVELEAKQANVRETVLRISGAIQVLEELLGQNELKGGNGSASLAPQDTVSSIAQA